MPFAKSGRLIYGCDIKGCVGATMFTMSNLIGWAVILGAVYFFSKTFRREVNGWIVKLSDKVKDDTNLPKNRPAPVAPTPDPAEQRAVDEVALLLYEIDYPPTPGAESGWHGQAAGMKWHYQERARARLAGVPYVSPDEEERLHAADGK